MVQYLNLKITVQLVFSCQLPPVQNSLYFFYWSFFLLKKPLFIPIKANWIKNFMLLVLVVACTMFWLGQHPWAIKKFVQLHLENGIIYPCLHLEIFSFPGCVWFSLALLGELWNKAGSAQPPVLCNEVEKHDTSELLDSPLLLQEMWKSCCRLWHYSPSSWQNWCSQLDWGQLLLMMLKLHVL